MGLMYDINEGYILQKTEDGIHRLRRETNVGINLLFRILPARIVDKIIMDLSSVRESDRRVRRLKMMEVGHPLVCNDFVARRIPKNEPSIFLSPRKRSNNKNAAGGSLSQSSQRHTVAYSGGRSSPRCGATKASSDASSDS